LEIHPQTVTFIKKICFIDSENVFTVKLNFRTSNGAYNFRLITNTEKKREVREQFSFTVLH